MHRLEAYTMNKTMFQGGAEVLILLCVLLKHHTIKLLSSNKSLHHEVRIMTIMKPCHKI
jgi:hypothetical protein